MSRRTGIRTGVVVGLTGILVVALWGLPTFAGPAFVTVEPTIVAVPGPSRSSRAVILPDGTEIHAGRLEIALEITNRYPLPVLIQFHGPAFRARLVDRAMIDGVPVWKATAEDPELERGDDSPDGGSGSARVIRIAPGITRLAAADVGMGLDLTPTLGAHSGIFTVQVVAYGIAGAPLLVSIGDATAAGPWPSDRQHPGDARA